MRGETCPQCDMFDLYYPGDITGTYERGDGAIVTTYQNDHCGHTWERVTGWTVAARERMHKEHLAKQRKQADPDLIKLMQQPGRYCYGEDTELCACGSRLSSVKESFGDNLSGHIVTCSDCGGERHVGEDGSDCLTCGNYSAIDSDGSRFKGNRRTGERVFTHDVEALRSAHFDGYTLSMGD